LAITISLDEKTPTIGLLDKHS